MLQQFPEHIFLINWADWRLDGIDNVRFCYDCIGSWIQLLHHEKIDGERLTVVRGFLHLFLGTLLGDLSWCFRFRSRLSLGMSELTAFSRKKQQFVENLPIIILGFSTDLIYQWQLIMTRKGCFYSLHRQWKASKWEFKFI